MDPVGFDRISTDFDEPFHQVGFTLGKLRHVETLMVSEFRKKHGIYCLRRVWGGLLGVDVSASKWLVVGLEYSLKLMSWGPLKIGRNSPKRDSKIVFQSHPFSDTKSC